MCQSFDSYNLILRVQIVNYRTCVKYKVQLFSYRNIRTTKILFALLKSDRIHVMFVSVIWITSVLTAFSLRTFSRDVKVVQSNISNEYTTVTELISFLFSLWIQETITGPFQNVQYCITLQQLRLADQNLFNKIIHCYLNGKCKKTIIPQVLVLIFSAVQTFFSTREN